MATLMRWDPFRDIMSLQRDVDRLMSDVGFWRAPLVRGTETALTMTPAIDVFTRGDDLVMRAELPGIRAEDVDISVTDDVLTLSAKRHEETEVTEEEYLVRETSWGTMERSMRLPKGAEVDKIHADYTDGILEVTVPKGAPTTGRTHKIEIESHATKKLAEHH